MIDEVKIKSLIILFMFFFFLFSNSVFSENESEVENDQNDNRRLKLRCEFSSSFSLNDENSDGILLSPKLDFYKDVSSRTSLSLRFMPLFVYTQSEENDVFGAGIGGSARFFFKKDIRMGFYTELHELALFHQNNFESNTSNFNFYSAIGIGYKFNENWDLTFRLGHISNANLKGDNGNVNLIGLGIGYSF